MWQLFHRGEPIVGNALKQCAMYSVQSVNWVISPGECQQHSSHWMRLMFDNWNNQSTQDNACSFVFICLYIYWLEIRKKNYGMLAWIIQWSCKIRGSLLKPITLLYSIPQNIRYYEIKQLAILKVVKPGVCISKATLTSITQQLSCHSWRYNCF